MQKNVLKKLSLGIVAAMVLVPAAAFASGGSGGGGTATVGVSATGGAVGGTGGGGTKIACITTLSVAATAAEALSGNSFSATFTLSSCQSRTKVGLTAIDIATGLVVYTSPDLIGTTAVWGLPYKLTSYQINARAYSGLTGATLATASTIVNTTDVLPCTPAITETVTTGYFGIYPAIWNATNAQNCFIPNTSTHLRITNLATGLVVYETSSPAMSWMLDFEGPIVAYSNRYEVDAELLDASGSILARSTQIVTSAPLR